MREKIISEIRRLSAKHGRPIGRELFEKEAAIAKHSWLGVYWARWGDALKEAGFDPNAKTPKTDLEVYFIKLANAFRHYGRVPVTAELRMYRKIDPSMPTHSTFDKTFGGKHEMLRQLKVWVSNKPNYADVANLLEEIEDGPKAEITSKAPANDGWVYVIQYGDSFKIGAGSDLERRVKQVTTKLPDNAELIHAIKTDDPFGIENYWHRRFADKRAKNNSEFFKLSIQDIRAMKRRKFM